MPNNQEFNWPIPVGRFNDAIPSGQLAPGNIDVSKLPAVKNPDGSYSTVNSMSVGTDEGEVLIPTVVNGKMVSPDEAVKHYRETGQHLGIFDTPDSATQYALSLHDNESRRLGMPTEPGGETWRQKADKTAAALRKVKYPHQ